MSRSPRRCSTWRWRTSASTSSWARVRARPPSRSSAPRCRSSAPRPGPDPPPGPLLPRPVRLHRPDGLSTRRPTCARSWLAAHRSSTSPSPTTPPTNRRRSRGTPRVANRLLRRVRDFAQVRADAASTSPSPGTPSRSTRSTRSASTATAPSWVSPLRGGPGRAQHARCGRRRGVRDRRDGVRAVPGPRRPARPYAAGPGAATPPAWSHLGAAPPGSPPLPFGDAAAVDPDPADPA